MRLNESEAGPQLGPGVDAVLALLEAMGLSDPDKVKLYMNRSGKSWDCVAYSSHIRFLNKITGQSVSTYVEQEDANIFGVTNDEVARLQARQNTRSLNTAAALQRAAEAAESDTAALRRVFAVFTTDALGGVPGERITTVGFLRLLRDCQCMDNAFGFVEADDILSRWLGAADIAADFERFSILIGAVAVAKFPRAATEADAREMLLTTRLIPYCPFEAKASSLDPLLCRSVMTALRDYAGQLTRVFAHYATIDVVDIAHTGWPTCVRRGATINVQEFILFLLNFGVAPHLISKREALALFRVVEGANDADRSVDKITYPAFAEFLLRASVIIGARLARRLAAPGLTVAEQASLRALLDAAPPGPKAAILAVIPPLPAAVTRPLVLHRVRLAQVEAAGAAVAAAGDASWVARSEAQRTARRAFHAMLRAEALAQLEGRHFGMISVDEGRALRHMLADEAAVGHVPKDEACLTVTTSTLRGYIAEDAHGAGAAQAAGGRLAVVDRIRARRAAHDALVDFESSLPLGWGRPQERLLYGATAATAVQRLVATRAHTGGGRTQAAQAAEAAAETEVEEAGEVDVAALSGSLPPAQFDEPSVVTA